MKRMFDEDVFLLTVTALWVPSFTLNIALLYLTTPVSLFCVEIAVSQHPLVATIKKTQPDCIDEVTHFWIRSESN